MSFGCTLHLLNCGDYIQGKKLESLRFCGLSIEEAGNRNLTGYRAVDGSTDDLYIRSQREMQSSVLPMPSHSKQSKVYF